jgi:hypothetical protein
MLRWLTIAAIAMATAAFISPTPWLRPYSSHTKYITVGNPRQGLRRSWGKNKWLAVIPDGNDGAEA